MNQRITMVGAWVLMIAAVASAAEPLAADRLREGEIRQAQIKAQTLKVSEQLGSIIAEFERNGLGGDDVQVLHAIGKVLRDLSDQQMQRVIELLQEARSSDDPSAARRRMTDAYAGQKTIVAQLRQLLLEYQRQQQLYELSLRLTQLAQRQDTNLKSTVALTRLNADLTRLTEEQHAGLKLQTVEQQAIRDEVNPVLRKLEGIAAGSEAATSERLRTALEAAKTGGLRPAMDAAVEDMKAANLFRAAGSQKTVRDQLNDLARSIAPPKAPAAALRQALQEVDRAIKEQKQLTEDTSKADPRRKEVRDLEPRQADVVDKTDLVRKDIANLAPEAARELAKATDNMQEARGQMLEQRRDEAVRKQQAAMGDLQQARQKLAEELARAQQQQGAEMDKLAALKDLLETVRQLIKDEEKLRDDTRAVERDASAMRKTAPRQAEIRKRTIDTQKRAATPAPDAAKSLGDAADQMDKVVKALADREPRNAPDAQQAAIEALRRAEQQLGTEIARLEQVQQDLAQMEDVRARIARLIRDQQQVGMDTEKAVALAGAKPTVPPTTAPAPKALSQDQGKVAAETKRSAPRPRPLRWAAPRGTWRRPRRGSIGRSWLRPGHRRRKLWRTCTKRWRRWTA